MKESLILFRLLLITAGGSIIFSIVHIVYINSGMFFAGLWFIIGVSMMLLSYNEIFPQNKKGNRK